MVTLKNDFLTIPDAPNFEINSELIVRNKIAGNILKGVVNNKVRYYLLRIGDKTFYRSAKSFRRQAVVAAKNQSRWLPVPSLGGKYELSRSGKLRNSNTKRFLNLHTSRNYIGFRTWFNGKPKFVTLKSLLWEVFGITCSPSKRTPVSCSAVKNRIFKKFDCLRDLAAFLAAQNNKLSFYTIEARLSKRCSEIDGWKIKYATRDVWSDENEAVSRKMLRGNAR